MPRGVSLQKAEQAIHAVEREREMRRKMFPDGSPRQAEKVKEMNIVLDMLLWAKKMLTVPASEQASVPPPHRRRHGQARSQTPPVQPAPSPYNGVLSKAGPGGYRVPLPRNGNG